MNDSATYVYAVMRDVDESATQEVVGLGGAPVRLVASESLVAIVSDVDRAEFETLDDRREDLEWLSTTARAHHHVVDALGRHHVVAPLSLATVYLSDDRVREVLAQRRGNFEHVLDRLRGRSEWGVKAFARRSPPGTAADERPRSGADYLRRRRDALRHRDAGIEKAVRAAEEVHAALGALAVEVRDHRLQESALTGEPDRMVLNGAYLVPVAASNEFTTLVGAFAGHEALRVELTGPWVPYSFSQVTTP